MKKLPNSTILSALSTACYVKCGGYMVWGLLTSTIVLVIFAILLGAAGVFLYGKFLEAFVKENMSK